jgi:predicted enzyme related to lactoylglutathione lyase
MNSGRNSMQVSHVAPSVTSAQPNILAVLARIYVDDLDTALPLYRVLAGGEEPRAFEFRGLQLAKIGPFLLIEGANAEIRSHAATIAVRDIDSVARAVVDAGGQLLDGPAPGPAGPRLIAHHPDGSMIEYIQLA